MPLFNYNDRDYISKLNQLAEDSTNASAIKGQIEELVARAEKALADQQAIASAPVNWTLVSGNYRMKPAEKVLVTTGDLSVYFPTSLEEGQFFTLKALADNVILRLEGYTINFPKASIKGPDTIRLDTGNTVTMVVKSADTLEVI